MLYNLVVAIFLGTQTPDLPDLGDNGWVIDKNK
jgi:hypothetical protein